MDAEGMEAEDMDADDMDADDMDAEVSPNGDRVPGEIGRSEKWGLGCDRLTSNWFALYRLSLLYPSQHTTLGNRNWHTKRSQSVPLLASCPVHSLRITEWITGPRAFQPAILWNP